MTEILIMGGPLDETTKLHLLEAARKAGDTLYLQQAPESLLLLEEARTPPTDLLGSIENRFKPMEFTAPPQLSWPTPPQRPPKSIKPTKTNKHTKGI